MNQSKHLSFKATAPVYTLNELSTSTEYIWIVFHGYAQLSSFFIEKFNKLDAEKNFIIAPQGLSKFYQKGFTGRVGATWMTREDRLIEIVNQKAYLTAVFEEYQLMEESQNKKIIYFGFSQGVSTMCRIAAYMKISFYKLILWAGSIPPELTREDFSFQDSIDSTYFSGKSDPFFKEGMDVALKNEATELFGSSPKAVWFDGEHQVVSGLIPSIISDD